MRVLTEGCTRVVPGRQSYRPLDAEGTMSPEARRFSSHLLEGRDLGQTLYLLKSLESSDEISHAATIRAGNELFGIALEKLGAPFTTEFSYEDTDNGLAAEDDQLHSEVVRAGYNHAQKNAAIDPAFSFTVRRAESDIELAAYFQRMPEGTTAVLASPCPDPLEVGASPEILEKLHYRPKVDQAMIWIGTRTAQGLDLRTVNLFHATPEKLARTLSEATGVVVDCLSREAMTENIIRLGGREDGKAIASQIIETFDAISTYECGERTTHGLKADELIAEHSDEAQTFIDHPDFLKMHQSSLLLIEQVAQSFYDEQLRVPSQYLQSLLEMKKSNGTYELEGQRRTAVQNVFNRGVSVSDEDFIITMQAVYTGACASLWATMAQLYVNGVDTNSAPARTNLCDSGGSHHDISMQGLKNIEQARVDGHVEHGCPGGGSANSQNESIFSMNEASLAETFLGKKVIKTNCPKCETKNVTAVMEKGTITCNTCKACVEVCSGKTLRPPNIKHRAKKLGKKTVSFFKSKKEKMNSKKIELDDASKSWLFKLMTS